MPYFSPKPVLFAIGIVGATLCGALTSCADAQSASTYQESCGGITISGATLFATCRGVDGSLNRTSIVLQGIENIDGQLQFTQPGQVASFQNSCRHIRIVGSTLIATCRRADGRYQRTSIAVPGIANLNGTLEYTGLQ
jgi:CVNH domain